MKRLRFVFAIGLVAAFGIGTAHAQQRLDHLKCYKIKDPAKFTAAVSLQALQSAFGLEDCRLTGKSQMFCVMVDKTVTAFSDKSKLALQPSTFPGQKLDDDRLCYKLKCPKPNIADQLVTDQFGARQISKFVPVMLCTPAHKGGISHPEPCNATTPQCNGLCQNPADICRPVGPPPSNCTCVPPPHPPCDATFPQCNGDCPTVIGTPPAVCRPTADGTGCSCNKPPTACSGTAPQCNGDCPAGSQCLKTATGCDCFDRTACQNSAPACGGTCQIPGMNCTPNPVGCGCTFPNQ